MSVRTEPRTTLRVFAEDQPGAPIREVTDGAQIASELSAIGVRFERFEVNHAVPPTKDEAGIREAYRPVIEYVQQAGGYGTVDVVSVDVTTPNPEEVRNKFFAEHTHSDDEVRYFVEGSGAFYLRPDGYVYQLISVRGDLLFVPAGARHWFDSGPQPEFTAIRWFNNPEGWVGQFTGDPIATRFPAYE